MSKCPNCDRETIRTKDWACQWCGYPLVSGSYKHIMLTYKEIKEGKTVEPESAPEPETEPEAEMTVELQVEPVMDTIDKAEAERNSKAEEESVVETRREIEPVLGFEPEPEVPAMMLTADELLMAYAEDEVAADARFKDKLLRISGTLVMVDVKEFLDTHYIRLAGIEPDIKQGIKCIFEKKHSIALKKLEKGQTVTVQGVFNGSVMAIRMINCVLV